MLEGFLAAGEYMILHPLVFVVLVLGMIWGILFGAVPGLNGIVAVALLIPFTFGMGPIEGLVMLGSVYVGATFGGSISAILFNTPGSPEASCTALDGYPMAKKGQASKALGLALGASALGGLIGTVALITLSVPLAEIALNFGPPAYFALAFLGITAIASIGTKSLAKSLLSGFLGLFIATIGLDPLTGTARFTFGKDMLLTGIDFVPAIIGLFALSEVLTNIGSNQSSLGMLVVEKGKKVTAKLPSLKEFWALKTTWIRSSLIGTLIGVLPGVGATTASFISYSEAVRWSKNPEKFGTGVPEGIVAPESANNAAVGGAMVPLLALGIPGSATTAVMIGGLTIHGIIPGPMLMVQNKELVFSVFIGMLLANLIMIFFGIRAASSFAKILNVPYGIVGPSIIVMCMTGVYTLRNNIFDVLVMLVFGAIGFLMQKLDYPIAPMIIGLVLGKVAEVNLRRGLLLHETDVLAMATEPLTGVLLLFSLASLVYGIYGQLRRARENRQKTASEQASTTSS